MGNDGEQLALVPVPNARRRTPRRAPAAERPVAQDAPVATVAVDTPLSHLDRPFEYLVPAELDEQARPGARVRVRFAGRDHDGFLLTRGDVAEHTGRLAPLRTVVSPEPVLTPPVVRAARAVADHYGGTLADVLRLAVPPRHARAERSVPPEAEGAPSATTAPEAGGDLSPDEAWSAYPAGSALLRRLAAGESPWAAWQALPAQPPERSWTRAVAEAVRATRRSGRGVVVVVPDHRDVARLVPELDALLGPGECVQLTADLGPEARYRAFLSVLRGHARVVVGTRAAAWAPVRDPGLFLCWDDGDDLHEEPRAPYPHVREVLRVRAREEGAALLVGGTGRSVELQAWVERGELPDVAPTRAVVRAAAPAVVVAGEGHQEDRDPAARTARIPSVAWRALRDGLAHGPVLVQVPRHGYVVSLACQDCRAPVRCPRCEGPVGLGAGAAAPACRWCGTAARPGQTCRSCGSHRLRSAGVGDQRTSEELGRAFPSVRVVSSGGAHVVPAVDDAPALVVATPGAEPLAEGGYHAVALLDAWRLLDRASLDAGVEALRRWTAAASLARPPGPEGRPVRVVVCGAPPHGGVPAVEALVRWDPAWLASGELAERVSLGLPPARRHVAVRGPARGVQEVVAALVDAGHVALGPVPAGGADEVQVVVREEGGARPLAAVVHEVRAARSARKAPDVVRTVLDPGDGLL
ncbi:primosomal protein N' [Ornithinimicrobium humiphilum]|uniref:Probable replication restart protein PriA n=1 Tax=Ornithinimicrobium humiphilum TaxID=125288 RepID=A0A543KPM7_9MICO|nr:primosome assembly protein PriA [Ornithinimicrobium humiphilum]TQM97017.1 replication restart DNA helicase PriA [Ornithinimicrobium humiphilum]